jgi:glucose/mannose-6-phosphate isomerase
MQQIIKSFPQQITEAVQASIQASVTPIFSTPLQDIIIAGMGSSSVAGVLAQSLLQDKLSIPLQVSHDYTLPSYSSNHTLLIIISYSGNTEETISAFHIGLEKKAHMVVISSGGTLKNEAQAYKIPFLSLPTDLPPRSALAYNLTYVLHTLSSFNLFHWDFQAELLAAAAMLTDELTSLQKIAWAVVKTIQGKLPVIYTTTRYEGVALRMRQQLNENSKQLCWHQLIPELNHHEVVGWEQPMSYLAVLLLTAPNLGERLQLQQDSLQAIVQRHCKDFIRLEAKGNTLLIQSLYLIHLGDWISFYLATEKGVDPMKIQSIDQIKAALSQGKQLPY